MSRTSDNVIISFIAEFESFLRKEDFVIALLHYRLGEWHVALRKNGSHTHSVHGFGPGMLTAMNNGMRRYRGQEPLNVIG